jgi:23S rRNA pseudouridine1911/1915/1917 synthase
MDSKRQLQTSISAVDQGSPLIEWLSRRFLYLAEDAWIREIQSGRVLVNSRPAVPEKVLERGDLVSFEPEGIPEPEVNRDVRIIYESDDYLVINKPPNLPCHPGGIYRAHTLWTLLRERYEQPSFISRLDRETSGLLAVALSSAARKALDPQTGKCDQRKEYLVLVHGDAPDTIEADGWISPDPDSPVRKKKRFTYSMPERSRAQSCSTRFIKLAGDGELSLLCATLGTGRTHQIRATLCSLGFPVVGDKIYGIDDTLFIRLAEGMLSEADRRRLLIESQALHSARLELSFSALSPLLPGESRVYYAPLPPSYAALVRERLAIDLSDPDRLRALWD